MARAVLVAGVIACAATAARAQDGVEIEAGAITYERQGSVLEASGGVKARWDGNSLVADRVRYERDADRLLAEDRKSVV